MSIMLRIYSTLTLFCIYAAAKDADSTIDISTPPIPDESFGQDGCGQPYLTLSSGWFSSPKYPQEYKGNTFCEWIIDIKQDHVLEITFHDFELGESTNTNDYVLIYEEETNEGDEKYFRGSLKTNPNMTVTYKSKSNFVIIQFESDVENNFKGFNASYRSWDEYCDRRQLTDSGRVFLLYTYCIGRSESRREYFQQCYIWCNRGFVLSSNAKVTCQEDGTFDFKPQQTCELIPHKVAECEETNLEKCLYDPVDLADYWRRKEALIDPSEIEDIDFDLFPDISPIVAGRTATTKVSCIDNLIGYSYCLRKKNKKHAFNCKAFTKFPAKKLDPKKGVKKMTACLKCRAIECSSTVYI